MALLLDTHAFLWFIADDPRLSSAAAERIGDPAERVLVSAASLWEIVIKLGTGKVVLDRPIERLWAESVAENDFEALHVTPTHVLALTAMPLHHRDPFDRVLIAQATAEGLQLVSADAMFDAYAIERIW